MDVKENVRKYRERSQKTVVLRSGLEVTIRKLSPIPAAKFADYLERHGLKFEEGKPLELLPHLDQLARILLPSCVVSPKFGDKPDEETLAFDELEFRDLLEIITEIMDFSGLAEKTEIESFREKRPG